MRLAIQALLVMIAVLAVSGCAYKPLKAPCSADEGGLPVAYSALQERLAEPAASGDSCGPMRPI